MITVLENSEYSIEKPKDLEHLLELINKELGNDKELQDVQVDKIKTIMASYESNELDWEKYALSDKSRSYSIYKYLMP
jgi:uncharacterized protein YpuA (DUF1002 family)